MFDGTVTREAIETSMMIYSSPCWLNVLGSRRLSCSSAEGCAQSQPFLAGCGRRRCFAEDSLGRQRQLLLEEGAQVVDVEQQAVGAELAVEGDVAPARRLGRERHPQRPEAVGTQYLVRPDANARPLPADEAAAHLDPRQAPVALLAAEHPLARL